jgi:GntR family transcriptional regulator
MQHQWNERDPIFLQIREQIVGMILGNSLREDEQLPSVRQVAAEYSVNPITVMKAYQLLADEGVLDKRRGLGMFIQTGARERLLEQERRRFLDEEWPRILKRVEELGLKLDELSGAKTGGRNRG